MMRKFLYIILALVLSLNSYAQTKVYYITKLSTKPKIDGYQDEIWKNLPSATGFIQYTPKNGDAPSFKTLVKLGYTDKAIYVFAYLLQKPKKISDYLTPRDKLEQADWFGVFFDTYRNGQVAYAFIVTAAGVQVDKKIIGTTDDYQWDAVWRSAVRKTDYGWIVEMRIPFSQLRFSTKKQQVWGVNFLRNIQFNREIDSWNYMNIKQEDIISQFGLLKGLNGIHQRPRIDLYPHASYWFEKQTKSSQWAKFYKAGLDLKVGLNRSFTIDMMLIPDFGEVMADEPVLNLSPFETYYVERRQFFTEGTEIFNLGGIFYSRRIGGTPQKRAEVTKYLRPNEIIIKNPLEIQILNATKLTGKSKSNLGIGVLNAITAPTYAEILDTITGKERKILTSYSTNYNVFALRKDLANSSYIGFINTNKYVLGQSNYSADVSAVESLFRDKSRTFRVFFRSAVSAKYSKQMVKPMAGYMYSISLAKVKGNFKFSLGRTLYSNTYDPNDLGYLKVNNVITNTASVSYVIYRPFFIVRNWTTTLSLNYQNLYRPLRYIGTQIKFSFYGTLKNLTSVGMRLSFTPDKVYNYFEPRVENFVYIEPPKQNYMFWLSTDYSRKFAIDLQTGFYFPIQYKVAQKGGWLLIGPRFRIGNSFLFTYTLKLSNDLNNYGYVGQTPNRDTVFFGKRNVKTIENTIFSRLAFGPRSYASVRLRHYLSTVNYFDYYALLSDGTLVPLELPYHFLTNQDRSFNAFNIDFIYTWRFLPGSEFSIIYKRQVTGLSKELISDYFEDFMHFYKEIPGFEIFTVKLVIYI